MITNKPRNGWSLKAWPASPEIQAFSFTACHWFKPPHKFCGLNTLTAAKAPVIISENSMFTLSLMMVPSHNEIQ